MRYLVVLLAVVAVAACGSSRYPDSGSNAAGTSTSQSAAEPTSTTPVTIAIPSTTLPRRPPLLPAAISVASAAVPAGASRVATVVVFNNTSHTIDAYGCKELFALVLSNPLVKQVPQSGSCINRFPIPRGAVTFRVSFTTRYSKCAPRRAPVVGLPECLSDGKAPPLPPGAYQLTLVDLAGIVRPPPPTFVIVEPPVPPRCLLTATTTTTKPRSRTKACA